jgi:hypothetical protein
LGGEIRQERYLAQCDLVEIDEARARLGVGSQDDVLGMLAKRRGRSLAAGDRSWLIDIADLSRPVEDPIKALDETGAFEVLETGESL